MQPYEAIATPWESPAPRARSARHKHTAVRVPRRVAHRAYDDIKHPHQPDPVPRGIPRDVAAAVPPPPREELPRRVAAEVPPPPRREEPCSSARPRIDRMAADDLEGLSNARGSVHELSTHRARDDSAVVAPHVSLDEDILRISREYFAEACNRRTGWEGGAVSL